MRKKITNLKGFSLMEIMIVLLIVAIVAAASAPMISKKMVRAAGDASPWLWTGMSGSINFNADNSDVTASIGAAVDPDHHPRLYIKTNSNAPHIMLADANDKYLYIDYRNKVFSIVPSQYIPSAVSNGILIGDLDINTLSEDKNILIIGNGALHDYNAKIDNDLSNSIIIGNDTKIRTDGDADSVTIIGHGAMIEEKTHMEARYQLTSGTVIGKDAKYYPSEGADTLTAVVIGKEATADGSYGTAIGDSAYANSNGLALGNDASAAGNSSVALGSETKASGESSIAIGDKNTKTTKQGDMAIGVGAEASGQRSIAIGSATYDGDTVTGQTKATGQYSMAIGAGANASGSRSISIGAYFDDVSSNTKASAEDAIAIGTNVSVGASRGLAMGFKSSVNGQDGVAIGNENSVAKDYGVAVGYQNKVEEESSLAIGKENEIKSKQSITIGKGNKISENADNSIAIGYNLQIKDKNTIMIGALSDDSGANFTCKNLNFNGNIVVGNIDITNKLKNLSDRRLKNVGKPFAAGLEEIKKLKVFNYTYKDDKEKTPHVGVIAQDLMKIFPDAVIKGKDGFYCIRMEDMFYALVNAVKELDTKISNIIVQVKEAVDRTSKLEAEVKRLLEVIDSLTKQNAELVKRLEMLENK